MSLLSHLPAPQHLIQQDPLLPKASTSNVLIAKSVVPPYGYRKNWAPKTQSDFGDGGAFPEIHKPQYPMGLGLKKTTSNALVMKTDEHGKLRYDDIIRQGHRPDRVIHSRFSDLMPKPIEDDDPELMKPDKDVIDETTDKTKRALEALVEAKVAAAAPVRRAEQTAPAEYIKYTPSQQGAAFNSGSKQRLIRMVEAQKDPMEPPRFKINQKIPRGPPSPPPPLMHSPSRKVTAKEQSDWKIPPCISNWKNPRGYTIPLDKRVAADGRGLQSVHINENFAKLAEALYTADRKAREAVEMRAQIERKIAQKEKEAKEQQLQQAAEQARRLRAGIRTGDEEEDLAYNDREELRKGRAVNRAKERNLAAKGGRSRELDRDISEKIALGVPNPNFYQSTEAQFDSRLFNQSRGLDTGFEGGADDLYNIYDKPWRGDSEVGSHIYRPSKDVISSTGSAMDALESELSKKRFVPSKGFSGSDASRRLDGPVAFERSIGGIGEEEDPFNLSKFLSEVKKAQKRPGEEAPASSNRDTTHRKRERRD